MVFTVNNCSKLLFSALRKSRMHQETDVLSPTNIGFVFIMNSPNILEIPFIQGCPDSYEGIDDSTADVEQPVLLTSPSESSQNSEVVDVPPDSVTDSLVRLRTSNRTRRPPDHYGHPVTFG